MEELQLSETERLVLSALLELGGSASFEELSAKAGVPVSTVMSVVELLKSKGLAFEESFYKEVCVLTKAGEDALKEGLPEEALFAKLRERGGRARIEELVEELGPRASIALGEAKRAGAVLIEGGFVELLEEKARYAAELKRALESVARAELAPEAALRELERRGLVKRRLERRGLVRANEARARKALEAARPVISKLTSDDIVSGRWRSAVLKEYDVEALPPLALPGATHYFLEFLERVREILFEMGFEEVEGPFVEQEFWNFDVLFQAQDHPSREIHDTFWLKAEPSCILGASRELVERVKRVHERGCSGCLRGWGGEWSERVAARWILRTQMTSATARALLRGLEPPFRVFAIGKVFRPDKIDAKRLPEFYQLDGIVSEEGMSFSKLLGVLKEFFERLGFEKVKFKPAYFPFTEPSVEGYVWMEGKGWVEVFGAGMFRPEVLEIAGFSEPVGAWGMGLERIAMRFFDVDDIRRLYHRDARKLREEGARCLRKLAKLL